jgi:hypothetical protein
MSTAAIVIPKNNLNEPINSELTKVFRDTINRAFSKTL